MRCKNTVGTEALIITGVWVKMFPYLLSDRIKITVHRRLKSLHLPRRNKFTPIRAGHFRCCACASNVLYTWSIVNTYNPQLNSIHFIHSRTGTQVASGSNHRLCVCWVWTLLVVGRVLLLRCVRVQNRSFSCELHQQDRSASSDSWLVDTEVKARCQPRAWQPERGCGMNLSWWKCSPQNHWLGQTSMSRCLQINMPSTNMKSCSSGILTLILMMAWKERKLWSNSGLLAEAGCLLLC